MGAACGYAGAVYLGCLAAAVAPPAVQQRVRRVPAELVLAPLAVGYAAFLVPSWRADTLSLLLPGSLEAGLQGGWNPQFFPSLAGIATLFSRSALTAGSLWIHVLAVSVFMVHRILCEGIDRGLVTVHSLLLCAVSPPLGYVCHLATKALAKLLGGSGGGDPDLEPKVFRF